MMFSQLFYTHRIFNQLAKALIRLHVIAAQSEALLVTSITLLEIPCCGSMSLVFDFKMPAIIDSKNTQHRILSTFLHKIKSSFVCFVILILIQDSS